MGRLAPVTLWCVAMATARSATPACTNWVHKSSPNVGTAGNSLAAVAGISKRNTWAVGQYFVGVSTKTLVEHWNGHHWKRIPSPNVGAMSNELRSIRGTSAHDTWAVGDAVTSYPPGYNPSTGNNFAGVFALNSTSTWAVGSYSHGGSDRTLIEHCRQ
jgi:hypothetical protein